QRAGQVVWLLSLIPLLGALLQEVPVPRILFVNARALPLLASALTTGWMAVQAGSRNRATRGSQPADRSAPDELAGLYATWSVLGGAWLIAQETYLEFSWHWIRLGDNWQIGALFTIASLWGLYGLAGFAL